MSNSVSHQYMSSSKDEAEAKMKHERALPIGTIQWNTASTRSDDHRQQRPLIPIGKRGDKCPRPGKGPPFPDVKHQVDLSTEKQADESPTCKNQRSANPNAVEKWIKVHKKIISEARTSVPNL